VEQNATCYLPLWRRNSYSTNRPVFNRLRQKEAEKLRDVTPAALTCLNEAFPHSLAANTHVETEERTRSAGTGILPELIMQKGAYHLLIGKGISEDTLITVLRAIDHA
jgi:hypothetical protein